jgi:hypothetical protein
MTSIKKGAVSALFVAATAAGVIFAPTAAASPLSDFLGSLNFGSSAPPVQPPVGPPAGGPAFGSVQFGGSVQGVADFTVTGSSCVENPPEPRNVGTMFQSVALRFVLADTPACAGRDGSVSYSVAVRERGSTSYGNFEARVSRDGWAYLSCGASNLRCSNGGSSVTFDH